MAILVKPTGKFFREHMPRVMEYIESIMPEDKIVYVWAETLFTRQAYMIMSSLLRKGVKICEVETKEQLHSLDKKGVPLYFINYLTPNNSELRDQDKFTAEVWPLSGQLFLK